MKNCFNSPEDCHGRTLDLQGCKWRLKVVLVVFPFRKVLQLFHVHWATSLLYLHEINSWFWSSYCTFGVIMFGFAGNCVYLMVLFRYRLTAERLGWSYSHMRSEWAMTQNMVLSCDKAAPLPHTPACMCHLCIRAPSLMLILFTLISCLFLKSENSSLEPCETSYQGEVLT